VFVRGRFRPVKLRGSSINILVDRGVLALLAIITTSLVIINNIYKHVFI
jgi:hypothetical protein